MVAERIPFQIENEKLKMGLNNLSSFKHVNVEKIFELEKDLEEAQSFSKAFQQAEYFYKIPLNKGNFDVRKDFNNENLILIEENPYEEAEEEPANTEDVIVDV